MKQRYAIPGRGAVMEYRECYLIGGVLKKGGLSSAESNTRVTVQCEVDRWKLIRLHPKRRSRE